MGRKRKTKYMLNVMHVSNLAKNLIFLGQIVEQGMQVKFKQSGCFIEKHRKLIAKGGLNVVSDVEMWHK